MSADYQLNLHDYLAILKRRALLIVATFGGVFAVAVAVALLIPPVYQSTGTIMVESQQIPNDLVQATVTSFADERIEIIKQRVMTRENLLRIANKYRLYEDARSTFTPSEAVDDMRDRIRVELVNANVQARQRATIAFRVSYEHRRPEVAQRVANELVTLFLDENVKVRTERATQTTEFLTQEADKLRTELETLEGQIASYKLEHGGALPDNLALSMTGIQRLEAELRNAERDQRAAQEELRSLEIELSSVRAGVGVSAGVPGAALPPKLELERAQAELARIAATYTDNHPDVRALKRKIQGLEQAVRADTQSTPSAGGSGAINSPVDLAVARLESRIQSVRSQAALLTSQQASLRGRIAQLEGQMLRAPQVERGLATLMRDQQTAQKKYDEIRAKQMTAQVAENLEGDQKAERFSLLEPPLTPDRPIKPDRRKMIALGFFLALAAAGGVVALLETLHGRVRGVEAVTAITGLRPMVTVPYITHSAEAAHNRRLLLQLGAGAGAVVLVGVAVVHFLYMPLDLVVIKIFDRLG